MKKKNTPRAKQGQYGKLTAKEKARIDKDFDGMAALFSDDDAARNAAKKRREAEYTPPPIQTELDILLERLNQLPIDEHDHDLSAKVMRHEVPLALSAVQLFLSFFPFQARPVSHSQTPFALFFYKIRQR